MDKVSNFESQIGKVKTSQTTSEFTIIFPKLFVVRKKKIDAI